jgi:hypothetical protein
MHSSNDPEKHRSNYNRTNLQRLGEQTEEREAPYPTRRCLLRLYRCELFMHATFGM